MSVFDPVFGEVPPPLAPREPPVIVPEPTPAPVFEPPIRPDPEREPSMAELIKLIAVKEEEIAKVQEIVDKAQTMLSENYDTYCAKADEIGKLRDKAYECFSREMLPPMGPRIHPRRFR